MKFFPAQAPLREEPFGGGVTQVAQGHIGAGPAPSDLDRRTFGVVGANLDIRPACTADGSQVLANEPVQRAPSTRGDGGLQGRVSIARHHRPDRGNAGSEGQRREGAVPRGSPESDRP